MASETREELYQAIVNVGILKAVDLGLLDGSLGQPGSASVTVDTLAGAGVVGKEIMKSSSAAAVRTAIGAGTSDLIVGSTAAMAKAGNYVPSTAEVATALKAKASIVALTSLTGTPDAAALTVAVNAIITALKI